MPLYIYEKYAKGEGNAEGGGREGLAEYKRMM